MSNEAEKNAGIAAFAGATREGVVYLPGTLVRALAGALALPLLSIFLVPADIGRYDLTARFVEFLNVLCAFWLGMAIVRYHPSPEQQSERGAFLDAVGTIQTVGIAIGLLLVASAYFVVSEDYRSLLLAAGAMFIGYALFQTGLMMLRAKSMAGSYSVSLMVSSVGRLMVGIPLALVLGVNGLLWGAAFIYFGLFLAVASRHFTLPKLRISTRQRQFLREMLHFGLPMGLGAVMAFFLNNGDRYILQQLRSNAEVGLFAVGSQFGEQPLFVIYSSLMLAAFPAASRAFDGLGRRSTEDLVRSMTRTYLLMSAPIAALLIVLARPFFGMFPDAYVSSGAVMPWIAFATFLQGLSQYPTLGLLVTKRTRTLFAVNTVVVLANLGANALLIPHFGFSGCGVSRTVANTLLLLLIAAATCKTFTWRLPVASFLRILAAATATGAAVYAAYSLVPTPVPLPVAFAALTAMSCLGISLYVTLLIVLRELKLVDVTTKVRAVLRRSRVAPPV